MRVDELGNTLAELIEAGGGFREEFLTGGIGFGFGQRLREMSSVGEGLVLG